MKPPIKQLTPVTEIANTTVDTMPMDSPAAPPLLQWTTFLPELRHEILLYLNETDLAEVSMVSRQLRDDCRHPSLPQHRIARIQCKANQGGFHYLHPLAGALLKVPTQTNGFQKSFPVFQQRFTCFKIDNPSSLPKIPPREAKPIIKAVTMSHVTHLDLSSSSGINSNSDNKSYPHVAPSVAKLLTQVVPDITVLDLSYNQVGTATCADFSRNCKTLTTIRLVGGMLASSINGMDLKQCDSLKELYLDDTLITASAKEEKDVFLEPREEESCPFQYCLRNLERVSFKGCQYFNMTARKEGGANHHHNFNNNQKPFTQLGLIKFVRNATKLKWFHSDLTAENVEMLQHERPNVVFVGHE